VKVIFLKKYEAGFKVSMFGSDISPGAGELFPNRTAGDPAGDRYVPGSYKVVPGARWREA